MAHSRTGVGMYQLDYRFACKSKLARASGSFHGCGDSNDRRWHVAYACRLDIRRAMALHLVADQRGFMDCVDLLVDRWIVDRVHDIHLVDEALFAHNRFDVRLR